MTKKRTPKKRVWSNPTGFEPPTPEEKRYFTRLSQIDALVGPTGIERISRIICRSVHDPGAEDKLIAKNPMQISDTGDTVVDADPRGIPFWTKYMGAAIDLVNYFQPLIQEHVDGGR